MMPFDSEYSRLESELIKLEEEVKTLEWLCGNGEDEYNPSGDDKRLEAVKRTLTRLTGLKELAELKLSVHKERVRESGVKY